MRSWLGVAIASGCVPPDPPPEPPPLSPPGWETCAHLDHAEAIGGEGDQHIGPVVRGPGDTFGTSLWHREGGHTLLERPLPGVWRLEPWPDPAIRRLDVVGLAHGGIRLLAGEVQSSTVLPSGLELVPPAGTSVFVARETPDGAGAWAQVLPGDDWSNELTSASPAPDGGVVLTTRPTPTSTRLHRLAADGRSLWEQRYEGVALVELEARIDPASGEVLVGGRIDGLGALDLGPAGLLDPAGPTGVVVRYDTAGRARWRFEVRAGTDVTLAVHDVAADGSVLIGGHFLGPTSFGPQQPVPVVWSSTTPASSDAWAARLSSEGRLLWITRSRGGRRAATHSLVELSDGAVAWVGAMFGDATLDADGPDPITWQLAELQESMFLVHLDGSTGQAVCGAYMAGLGVGDSRIRAVARSDGGLLLARSFVSWARFGAQSPEDVHLGADGHDAWVLDVSL